jgi:hypothetical protein
MFDPNLLQENTIADAAQMRGQFNGLKALIDLLQSIATAQVDAVNTLPPGDPANVTVSVVGSTLHLTFDIPQGDAGAAGSDGAPWRGRRSGPTGRGDAEPARRGDRHDKREQQRRLDARPLGQRSTHAE